jgi:hypothetical protein
VHLTRSRTVWPIRARVRTLRHMMGEELITHLGREYYD